MSENLSPTPTIDEYADMVVAFAYHKPNAKIAPMILDRASIMIPEYLQDFAAVMLILEKEAIGPRDEAWGVCCPLGYIGVTRFDNDMAGGGSRRAFPGSGLTAVRCLTQPSSAQWDGLSYAEKSEFYASVRAEGALHDRFMEKFDGDISKGIREGKFTPAQIANRLITEGAKIYDFPRTTLKQKVKEVLDARSK